MKQTKKTNKLNVTFIKTYSNSFIHDGYFVTIPNTALIFISLN